MVHIYTCIRIYIYSLNYYTKGISDCMHLCQEEGWDCGCVCIHSTVSSTTIVNLKLC